MTETEEIVETLEDAQKRDVRATLDRHIEELDTLSSLYYWGADKKQVKVSRSGIKKQVSKYRKHISNYVRVKSGRTMPTISEMHTELCGSAPLFEDMVAFFKKPGDHSYRAEWAKLLWDRLTYIDRYVPPLPPPHKEFGLFPVNHHRWVDQHGKDRWDSKSRVAEIWRKNNPEVKRWHSKGKE